MKTRGVSPKVPVQAIATVIAFALSYFAIDLDPEVAGAIAVLCGIGGGVTAGPGDVVRK